MTLYAKPSLLFLVALTLLTSRVEAQPNCSLKTLKGAYLYGATGLKDKVLPFVPPGENGQIVNLEGGQEIFDGRGNITNTYADGSGQVTLVNGSYSLDANCVGRAVYNSGDSYTLYASPTGNEFTWASISAGKKITGREVRVSRSLSPRCSLKTLKGTYLYSHMGYRNGIPYFETGKESYDGLGHLSNVYTDMNGHAVETNGTYALNGENCVAQATYEDTGDTYIIFMAPSGSEFRYVSFDGTRSNLAVGAEHRVSKKQF